MTKKSRCNLCRVQQWHYSTIEVDLTKCISNAEVARRIDTALKIENAKAPHSAITVTLTGQPYSELINLGIHEFNPDSSLFSTRKPLWIEL